mmetsp:Transcript_64482/g.203860  ORF Transcript_64482/g.203860 Transcript_64482/m.203860 type:complete len:310 (+) Transcript_64482:296-1225(+)
MPAGLRLPLRPRRRGAEQGRPGPGVQPADPSGGGKGRGLEGRAREGAVEHVDPGEDQTHGRPGAARTGEAAAREAGRGCAREHQRLRQPPDEGGAGEEDRPDEGHEGGGQRLRWRGRAPPHAPPHAPRRRRPRRRARRGRLRGRRVRRSSASDAGGGCEGLRGEVVPRRARPRRRRRRRGAVGRLLERPGQVVAEGGRRLGWRRGSAQGRLGQPGLAQGRVGHARHELDGAQVRRQGLGQQGRQGVLQGSRRHPVVSKGRGSTTARSAPPEEMRVSAMGRSAGGTLQGSSDKRRSKGTERADGRRVPRR